MITTKNERENKMTNTNESGRSMVEMLGVLAIIGVLSVMGIAGYTQAMKKHYTNEAAQAIAIASIACRTHQTPQETDYLTTVHCDGSDGDLKDLEFHDNVQEDMLEAMFDDGVGTFDATALTFKAS